MDSGRNERRAGNREKAKQETKAIGRRKGEKKNKDVSDTGRVARVDQTHDRRQLAPDWAWWSVCLTFIRIRIGILYLFFITKF